MHMCALLAAVGKTALRAARVHVCVRALTCASCACPLGPCGKRCRYLGWYRKVGKVILRVGDRVPADTPGDCKTDFITPPFPRVFLPVYAALNEYAVAHPNCSCELEYVSLQAEQDSPPFVDPEGRHHASSVGFAHDMLASDCAPLDCPWANGLRVEEMEIAVPLDRGQEALDFVSGFFHGRGAGLCFPLQGVWLRGARGDASFLGFGAQGAPMLVIGLTSWRPSGGLPRYHEDACVRRHPLA